MPDPISDGECTGLVAYSYGSYVYQWPSKLDQVFWPETDPGFIWHCPSSGLTAFQPEIEQLSDPEKRRVKAFLATGYDPATGPLPLRGKLVFSRASTTFSTRARRRGSGFSAYSHTSTGPRSVTEPQQTTTD